MIGPSAIDRAIFLSLNGAIQIIIYEKLDHALKYFFHFFLYIKYIFILNEKQIFQ